MSELQRQAKYLQASSDINVPILNASINSSRSYMKIKRKGSNTTEIMSRDATLTLNQLSKGNDPRTGRKYSKKTKHQRFNIWK